MAPKNRYGPDFKRNLKAHVKHHDAKKPLRRPRHEAFAIAFAEHFDAVRAASEAGYSSKMAGRIWPLLLRREDVKLRLQAIRDGRGFAPTHPDAVFRRLAQSTFLDQAHLFSRNPMTGEPVFDLAQATDADLNALEIDHRVSEINGQRKSVTRLKTPGRSSALTILARRLGLFETDPHAKEPDFLTSIVMEINEKGGSSLRPVKR